MKQKVLLLGGHYGSGKSTLAENLIALNGRGTNLDFDIINQRLGGFDPTKIAESDLVRAQIWQTHFPSALRERVEAGDPLIIVAATFAQRQRRDNFLKVLQQYQDTIDIYPLLMMLPMRETIGRIRRGRIGSNHLINDETVIDFYRKANRIFRDEDHTDLLLPSNRSLLPPEYRPLLSRNQANKNLLEHPKLDTIGSHPWVVATGDIDASTILKVIQGSTNPLMIRDTLEGRRVYPEGVSQGFKK